MDAFQFGKYAASAFGVQPTHTAPLVQPASGGNPIDGPDLRPLQQRPTVLPTNVITGPDLRPLQQQGSPSLKLAELMLPPPRTTSDPAAFSRAVASMTEPNPLTGALPQFDASRGGKPLEVPAKPEIPPSVAAWGSQGSANDPLGFDMQGLKDTAAIARGFIGGFHPKVNPVTGFVARFADNATDPNKGFGKAVWHEMGGDNPNSFVSRTSRFVDNAYGAADDIKKLTGQAVDATAQKPTDPAALAAAQAAPKPTMGSYLSGSMTSNPLWMLPAAGLGGLGMYGLYKLMSARRDANKKRRRLMNPAAIIH